MEEDKQSQDFIEGYADGLQDGIKGTRRKMAEELREWLGTSTELRDAVVTFGVFGFRAAILEKLDELISE